MLRPILSLLFVVLFAGFPIRGAQARHSEAPAGAENASPALETRVLRSELDGVALELVTPRPEIRPGTTGGGDPCELVTIPGLSQSTTPGAPELPVRGIVVGIPPGAEIDARVVAVSREKMAGAHRLCAAPAPGQIKVPPEEWTMDALPGQVARTGQRIEDPAIYQARGTFPTSAISIREIGFIRHQRVAQIEFYPVQADLLAGEVYYSSRVRVEIAFQAAGGRAGVTAMEAVEEPAAYETLLKAIVANYSTAKEWRAPPRSEGRGPSRPAGSLNPGYKIVVKRTGIYQITYADLQAAGLPVDSLNPRTFQVFYHDREVAVYVDGEENNHFDPGEYLLFYGEGIADPYHKYAKDNVYWLTYGQEQGRRMPTRDGSPRAGTIPAYFPQTVAREVDTSYWSKMPGGDDDMGRWYWTYSAAPGNMSQTVVLTDVVTGPPTAHVAIMMYGYNNAPVSPDHHVIALVNEHQVGEFSWEGQTGYLAQFDFPHGYLQAGANVIRLQSVLDPGVSTSTNFLDWFQIDYQRDYAAAGDVLAYAVDEASTWQAQVDGFTGLAVETFDVTEPITVQRVISTAVEANAGAYRLRFSDSPVHARYWSQAPAKRLHPASIQLDTPSALRSEANGADYVMISHASFEAGLQPLADYYTSAGMRVQVVDVQDVFDEFSGGVYYPGAIRDFLRYAFERWSAPAPTYVLLVGDGHYDYKLLSTSTNLAQYMPPYMAYVDPWTGETATDNRYVSVMGDDGWPDLIVGRFPVNNAGELAAMVTKSLAYQQSPPAGDWKLRTLFVTDNPDNAGNFYAYSDAMADGEIPPPYTTQKVYYGLPPYTVPSDAKAAIKAAFADGRLLISYIGHAAIPWWAEEQLLHQNDVATLAVTNTWPIMLPMTCQEGYFVFPWSIFPSLSEVLVRAAGKGAIASWAPSGWGVVDGHDLLERGFLRAVFSDGVRRVGDATLSGKQYLWTYGYGGFRELIETYVLLGDPALHIAALDTDMQVGKTLEPAGQLVPGDAVTYTLAFTNTGPAMAFGVTLTDELPSELVNPVVEASPEVLGATPGVTFAWTITDLAPGAAGWVRVRAEVGPITESHTMVNQAEIDNNIPDTDEANNTDWAANTLYLPKADVRVAKTVEPAGQLEPGDVLTYTLSLSNDGPDVARGLRLADTIPVELVDPEVVYASPGVTRTPGITFAWQIADLEPGGSRLIRVRAVVGPLSQSHSITNQAVIATTTFDPVPANNSSAASSYLYLPNADMQIVKTVEPAGQLRPGDVLTYTLSFANGGPDPALGVVLTDVIPAKLISPTVVYESPEVISRSAGITFAWQIADLEAGQDGLIQVRAVISPSVTPGFVIVNEARISARTADFVPTNNTSSRTIGVNVPDVAAKKSGPAAATFSQTITYAVTWGNTGLADAEAVLITDTLPAWVSYMADNSGWAHSEPAPGQIAWHVEPDPLPPGVMQTFVLTGWVTMDPDMSGPLVNQVVINTESPDADPNNDTAQWSTGLLVPDLGVSKRGPDAAATQSEISYTVAYSNSGAVAAAGVLITDVLPSGVTYVSDDSGLPHTEPKPGVHVWQVQPDPLPAGAGGAFAVTVHVGDYAQVGNSLHNAIEIGAGLPDADRANDSDEWTTAVLLPDLAIGLAGPEQAVSGAAITYTLAFSNVGDGPAWGAVITDVLPAGVTYTSDDSGLLHAEPEPGVHVWQVGTGSLPAGASDAFHVVARLGMPDETGPSAANQVSIRANAGADPVPGNDTAGWTTNVVWPDLAIGLAGPAVAQPATTITYTLSFANIGTAPAEGAVITDVLPLGVTYMADDSGFARSQPQPGVYAWQVTPEPLPAGSSGAFHLVVRLGTVGQTGMQLLNRVEIGTTTPDPTAANDTAFWWTIIPKQGVYLPLVVKGYLP